MPAAARRPRLQQPVVEGSTSTSPVTRGGAPRPRDPPAPWKEEPDAAHPVEGGARRRPPRRGGAWRCCLKTCCPWTAPAPSAPAAARRRATSISPLDLSSTSSSRGRMVEGSGGDEGLPTSGLAAPAHSWSWSWPA